MVTENRVENNADDQKIRRFLFSMRLSMNFGLNKRCTFTEPLNRIHMTHCSIHPNELIFLFRRETYTPNERYSFIFAVYILWEQNLQKKDEFIFKKKKILFLFERAFSFNEIHIMYMSSSFYLDSYVQELKLQKRTQLNLDDLKWK